MTDTKTAAQLATESGIGKRTRTPRSYDDILRGAKALTLKERVELVKTITGLNNAEAGDLKALADEAAKLVG